MLREPNVKLTLQTLTPLFILGIPRSGTTLLLSLLDGHFQLLADVGESRFFTNYLPRAKNKTLEQKLLIADRHLLHMFDPDGVYYQNLLAHIPHRQVRSCFEKMVRESNTAPKDFLESYVFSIGLASGTLSNQTLYWVEKTPGNEYFLDAINRWWPHAKYIHVVRDPRDVYTSYKNRAIKNKRKIPAIDQFAFAWGKSIKMLQKYRRIVGDQRYFVLNYESLVENFEDTLSDVVEYLAIRDEEILHCPTKGHGQIPWGGNAETGEKKFHVHRGACGKWKSVLSGEEIRGIESMLHREMALVGYSLASDFDNLGTYPIWTLKNHMRELKFKLTHRHLQ